MLDRIERVLAIATLLLEWPSEGMVVTATWQNQWEGESSQKTMSGHSLRFIHELFCHDPHIHMDALIITVDAMYYWRIRDGIGDPLDLTCIMGYEDPTLRAECWDIYKHNDLLDNRYRCVSESPDVFLVH